MIAPLTRAAITAADMRSRAMRTRLLLAQVRRRLDDASIAADARDLSTLGAMRALVIAPHPDDEVIGCGGLIWHLVQQRVDVSVLFLTREGARSITPPSLVAGVPRRTRESRAAQGVLWYERAHYLSFEELSLEAAARAGQLQAALAPRLAAADADLVIAPSVHEMHPDHRAASRAVVQAVHALWSASAMPSLRAVLLYEIWGANPVSNATIAIPHEAMGDLKAALACYESQLSSVDYQALLALLKERRASSDRAPADTAWREAYEALWSPADAARYLAAITMAATTMPEARPHAA